MESIRALIILTVIICLLLLTLTTSPWGNDAVAGIARRDTMASVANPPDAAATMLESTVQSDADSSRSCLPYYSDRQFLLQVNETSDLYEAFPTSADLNGDGLEDVVIRRTKFLTYDTYELDILLNDGSGGMTLATSAVFSGTVPAVQNPAEVIVADFNGDDRPDIFVADHGYDLPPHPGYQNQLALTTPDGKLVNAAGNLPQLDDFTHSACAADIDADEDLDLYVGNIWGQNDYDPRILLNDGNGRFTVGENRLPPLVDLSQNGYTTCEFTDVNNDDAPDLILGDAGDDISNEQSTPDSEVLLNDGTGVFMLLPNAMPPKDFASSDIAHDIEPLDINGDAYVDLFIEYERQQGVSYIQALINNQDGTFRNETMTGLESFDRQVSLPELELRDLDRDGDLDLLAMPWDADNPDPLLFLNDGNGYFSWKPFDFGLRGGDLYFTFLDLDGDGGHDILLTLNYPPEYVFAIRDLGCPVFLPLVCRDHAAGRLSLDSTFSFDFSPFFDREAGDLLRVWQWVIEYAAIEITGDSPEMTVLQTGQ